ncbi:hypothetical protein RCL1_006782 [Eukaryota sp. TZLM3-RCL]
MIHHFLLFCCTIALVSAACTNINLFEWLKDHEGVRNCVYTCTAGHPTIGIGFNLDRSDAPTLIKNYTPYDYRSLRLGSQCFKTNQEMEYLMQKDLELNFYPCARSAVRNYESLPQPVRTIIVDMVFNLGCAGFKSFKNTIAAFERRDFSAAAAGMEASLWCRQVGRRCTHDVGVVRGCIGK